VVVLILGAVINHFATLAVAKTGLSGTDRLIGAFFGAARGIALVAALVLVGGLTNLARDPWWQQSRLIPYVQPVAHWMMHFLPTHLRKNVRLQ
jgi:membrane protein required for colicin V production